LEQNYQLIQVNYMVETRESWRLWGTENIMEGAEKNWGIQPTSTEVPLLLCLW